MKDTKSMIEQMLNAMTNKGYCHSYQLGWMTQVSIQLATATSKKANNEILQDNLQWANNLPEATDFLKN